MRSTRRDLVCGLGLLGLSALASAALAQSNAVPKHPIAVQAPPSQSLCRACGQPYALPEPTPPAHFDPLTATDEELAYYGFPPRPDAATALGDYANWEMVVTLPVTRVAPQQLVTSVKHGPMVPGSGAARLVNPAAIPKTSTNWSGYAIADGTHIFRAANTTIFGSFVVPVAAATVGSCDGVQRYSASWVGIDGFDSDDVLQAGIEGDAICNSGVTTSNYYAWYEWYPNYSVAVASPAVAPGDLIYVYVWNRSLTQGDYYMVNVTQGVSSSLTFHAPAGTKLDGDSAEWIVEAPGVNGSISSLANYIGAPWYNASVAVSGASYDPTDTTLPSGAKLYSLTMVDSNSKPISDSFATPETAPAKANHNGAGEAYGAGSSLWFFDEGSAY